MKKILSAFVMFVCLVVSTISFAVAQKIYVYLDEGVDTESFYQASGMFNNVIHKGYTVQSIDAKSVIDGNWRKDAVLFVIPGGADLPYCKKLNGKGNKQIKEYVEGGGSFLGLCAGGYYGSAYVEFDKGGELQVLGDRELKFFDGTCKGPILAKYDYHTEGGSRAAKLEVDLEGITESVVYYNGGGYFVDAYGKPNTTVIAGYTDKKDKKGKAKAAIVHMNVGKGSVVLSGVHFEYDPNLLDSSDNFIAKLRPTLMNNNDSRKVLCHKVFELLVKPSNDNNKN